MLRLGAELQPMQLRHAQTEEGASAVQTFIFMAAGPASSIDRLSVLGLRVLGLSVFGLVNPTLLRSALV